MLSVRTLPSPYIGDGSVLYRSVKEILVCSFVTPQYAEYEEGDMSQ